MYNASIKRGLDLPLSYAFLNLFIEARFITELSIQRGVVN